MIDVGASTPQIPRGIEMADASKWSLGDLGAIGEFILMAAGYMRLSGRQSKTVENLSKQLDGNVTLAETVAKQLAEYKLEALEKFATKEDVTGMGAMIMARMDRQDDKLDSAMDNISERVDRVISHSKN